MRPLRAGVGRGPTRHPVRATMLICPPHQHDHLRTGKPARRTEQLGSDHARFVRLPAPART
jgi:hypothetical protein